MSDLRPMPEALGTPRLALEPFPVTEVPVYRAILGRRADDMSDADLAGYLRQVAAGKVSNVIAMYALRRRAEGDIVGYCGLIVGRATVEEPEIASELMSSVHNQGYGTEAATAVVAAAAATGRFRLWATVGSWNAPSLRVLEKIGFRRDHTTVDAGGEVVWNVLDLEGRQDATSL
jgi:GNAT superfamily N-acetyltransferase